MKKGIWLSIAFLLCFTLAAISASAQVTAQISGRVTDSSDAAVPGANVRATNLNTSAVRTTTTNDEGAYLLAALPLGPYKLEVSKPGFQTYTQSGIVLQVGSSPVANVKLQVGSAESTVEVQADAGMVETRTTGVGTVIEPEQIVDLPLNGRQPTQLISLSGAAVPVATGGLHTNLDYPTSVAFSVAGSQPNATNYTLDNSPDMDYRTNVGSPMPFPDALQEFKVESSALPANSGSRPGGTVSAVTRSGTNNFHGDVFEFFRNGAMDADAYSFPNSNGSVPPGVRDNLKRNQFGGTIGGPVKKDKLFMFYGFQETTERQQNQPVNRVIPTPAMLAGDFTAFLAPPCQSRQIYLNDTVPSPTGGAAQPLVTAHDSNILLPGWVNTPSAKLAAKIAALFSVPTNPCGNVTVSSHNHDNEYQHVARVDWQRTPNDTIFGRYFIADYNLLSALSGSNLLTSSGPGLADRVQNVALGDTHVISPQVVSSFRLYYGRTASRRTSNNQIPTLCSLGMNATCGVNHQMLVNISGINLPGYLGYDFENVFGLSENIGWQLHSHELQFGFLGQLVQMNGDGTFQVNPVPGYTNGSSSYTGNSYADFVTGNLDTYGQGNGQLSRDSQKMPSLYFQDSWKVTRTFNFNYGVRWDPFFPQHNKYGMATDFNLANYYAGVKSKVFSNAPPGVTFPGDPGFGSNADTNSKPFHFSPRVGFVWDPGGKGKQTIRGGYGIFYDTSMMWNTMHIVLNQPWGATTSFTPAPVNVSSPDPLAGGGLANPWFGVPAGNPFPTPLRPAADVAFRDNGAFVFQDRNITPASTQQWNLSIERQFGANWLVSASYLGNKGSHIWLGQNLDPSVIITAGMTAPGIVSTAGMTGTSGPCTLLYEGKQVTFPTCNAPATVTVSGVNNENARKALVLANPTYGPIFNGGLMMAQSIGNSSYNGLLLSVKHRLSHGFSVSTNYTWSHCLDQGEVSQDIGATMQNPNNRRAEWGNCSYDRRQVLNVSLIGQTPRFGSIWTQRLLGDWSASTIFVAESGDHINVIDGADISLIGLGGLPGTGGSGNDRPDQVGNPYVPGPVAANPTCVAPTQVNTPLHWFNPCAFQKQAPLTFGNTARNSLVGPGRWNADMALWRTFPITERFNAVFRAEAFNVFNHPQFGDPGTNLGSTSTLGRITSLAGDPRILQMSLKLTF